MKTAIAATALALFSVVGTSAQQKLVSQKPLTVEQCELDSEKWTRELTLDSLHRLSHHDLFIRQRELADCREVIPVPSAFPRKGESMADSAIRYGLEMEVWSESMKLSWLYAAEVASRASLYINTQGLADKYEVFENGLVANGR